MKTSPQPFSFQIPAAILAGVCFGFMILIGLPWTHLLGLMVVLGFMFLFFTNPLLCLGVLFFLRAGIDSYLLQVRFSGLGLGGGLNLLLIVLAVMAFITARDQTLPSKIDNSLIKVLALFCFFLIFNTLYSYDRPEALKTILRYFSLLAVTILVIMNVKKKEGAYFLLKAIAASFVPTIIMGFVAGHYYINEVGGQRYCASLTHPNILAFYLLTIMACYLTGLTSDRVTPRSKLLTALGMGSMIVMLLFTRTRSGYAAVVILFMLYAVFKNPKMIIPILLLCAAATSLPMVKGRINSLYEKSGSKVSINRESSFGWRLEKWGYLTREAIKKPIVGHGIGASNHFGEDELAAHNDYVRFFLESGLVGLFLYFAPYFILLKEAFQTKARYPKDSLLSKISYFFLIFVPPFLLMSISENLASYVVIQWYLWAVAGIFISLKWRAQHVEA